MLATEQTLVVCVGVFMSSLDLFVVNIAFPSIEEDFGGASLSSLSWILNAYAIARPGSPSSRFGAALGIAILVAVLGTAVPTAAGFHDAWIVPLVSAAVAG